MPAPDDNDVEPSVHHPEPLAKTALLQTAEVSGQEALGGKEDLFADAKAREDHVEDLVDVDATREPAERPRSPAGAPPPGTRSGSAEVASMRRPSEVTRAPSRARSRCRARVTRASSPPSSAVRAACARSAGKLVHAGAAFARRSSGSPLCSGMRFDKVALGPNRQDRCGEIRRPAPRRPALVSQITRSACRARACARSMPAASTGSKVSRRPAVSTNVTGKPSSSA